MRVQQTENYYSVEAKCGHVGRSRFIRIFFPVHASSAKKAAEVARNFPRVKRNHKDCILSVRKIDYECYMSLWRQNSLDPYLRCHSKHEQNCLDLSSRLEREPERMTHRRKTHETQPSSLYKKKRVRNFKHCLSEESRKEEDLFEIHQYKRTDVINECE